MFIIFSVPLFLSKWCGQDVDFHVKFFVKLNEEALYRSWSVFGSEYFGLQKVSVILSNRS